MTIQITDAALRVYDEAWQKAHHAPGAGEGDGRRAGLASVLHMPEVRRALLAEMIDRNIVRSVIEHAREILNAIDGVDDEPEAWGTR